VNDGNDADSVSTIPPHVTVGHCRFLFGLVAGMIDRTARNRRARRSAEWRLASERARGVAVTGGRPAPGLLAGLADLRRAIATALAAGAPAPRPALAMAAVGAADGLEPLGVDQATPSPRRVAAAPPTDGAIDGAIDGSADVVVLVARAQAGDAAAFGELYDRYVDLVHRYVYYRVGSRALAEDLTSETFLRALRRISSFTWQGRDIGAWFVTIARNLIADHYKSGRFRLEVQVADMLDADRAEDGPEDAVLDALTSRTLLEAVRRLGPEQQECIVLRFLQGLSVAETALAMGKNEGAIKALQYRAVRTLGRLLPEGFAP
jgi:RNA polymerase sigma-70 factor, ECF subfamily